MNDLNRNELEALRVLWDIGEAKPTEIEAAFAWPIDNGTLRSVLRVLMEKELVTRTRVGKAYLYKAKRSRKGVMATMAKQMAQVFTGGSTTDLIAQLIQTQKLKPEELAELRKIADSESSTKRQKKE
jgi:BlaI family transcriptional regulator, penicillinase repressor